MMMKLIKWRETYTPDMMTPIAAYNAAVATLADANRIGKHARSLALGRLNKARAEVKRLLDAKQGKQPAPRYEPLAKCTIHGMPCYVAAVGGRHTEPDLYAVNANGYVMQFLMDKQGADDALYDAYMMHLRGERKCAVESAAIAGDMGLAARLARTNENYGEYW
jgi:hypothetical protein